MCLHNNVIHLTIDLFDDKSDNIHILKRLPCCLCNAQNKRKMSKTCIFLFATFWVSSKSCGTTTCLLLVGNSVETCDFDVDLGQTLQPLTRPQGSPFKSYLKWNSNNGKVVILTMTILNVTNTFLAMINHRSYKTQCIAILVYNRSEFN